MIGIPMNPNSVYIPYINTGCCKGEFDSTYPIHLNGIINPDEFQESIKKINRTNTSYKYLIIIFLIIYSTIMISGGICFLINIILYQSKYSVLIIIGINLIMLASLFFCIGYYIILSQGTSRIQRAIAEESMKYSSRSPIPCSWRLDIPRSYNNQIISN
ncbi:unnamed protein product, partial [Rotaria sp. Silwood1]